MANIAVGQVYGDRPRDGGFSTSDRQLKVVSVTSYDATVSIIKDASGKKLRNPLTKRVNLSTIRSSYKLLKNAPKVKAVSNSIFGG